MNTSAANIRSDRNVGRGEKLAEVGMDELAIDPELARLIQHGAGNVDAVDDIGLRCNQRPAQPRAAAEVEHMSISLSRVEQRFQQHLETAIAQGFHDVRLEIGGIAVE